MTLDDDKTSAFRAAYWSKVAIMCSMLALVVLNIRTGFAEGDWTSQVPQIALLLIVLKPYEFRALRRLRRDWLHAKPDEPRVLWEGKRVTVLHRAIRSDRIDSYELAPRFWVIQDADGKRHVAHDRDLEPITSAIDLLGELVD